MTAAHEWDAGVLELSTWTLLLRARALNPEGTAVTTDDGSLTFRELTDRASRCAARLSELGVGAGTRVALGTGGTIDWSVLVYALARLGAVIVPLNVALESRELEHVLRSSEPEVLIVERRVGATDLVGKLERIRGGTRPRGDAAIVPSLRCYAVLDDPDQRLRIFGSGAEPGLPEEGCPAEPGDPFLIVFTSGSTAFPKGALCSHRSFIGAGEGLAAAFQLTTDDAVLATLPPFHTAGILGSLYLAHVRAAPVRLLGLFEPGSAIRAIQESGCTATICFDTIFMKMLAHPDFADHRVASLRKGAVGTTPSYLATLKRRWPLDLALGVYGSTESSGLLTVTDGSTPDAESNGRPFPGMEIGILDPDSGEHVPTGELGEVCFRGWQRFLGYLDPADTAKAIDRDGFFHSGDIGFVDERGELYYRGRYKMMVKTGGENVAEREVEIALETLVPEIESAQVVGIPDAEWGEIVVAFVQLSSEVSEGAIRERCRGEMANFKIPKRVFPMREGDWPTLANGKPDKAALRARAEMLSASRPTSHA